MHADDPRLVTSTPPATEPVAPAQLTCISALALVHADAGLAGGVALADAEGDFAGTDAIGEGDGVEAQAESRIITASVSFPRVIHFPRFD